MYEIETISGQLKDLKFNKVVDHYITTGRLSAEMYDECTAIQKLFLQTMKRSFKRIVSYPQAD